jgi:HPt (histidine-containing phosphotransfer) domain-containing protein
MQRLEKRCQSLDSQLYNLDTEFEQLEEEVDTLKAKVRLLLLFPSRSRTAFASLFWAADG